MTCMDTVTLRGGYDKVGSNYVDAELNTEVQSQ
jgi:hypothetical protein